MSQSPLPATQVVDRTQTFSVLENEADLARTTQRAIALSQEYLLKTQSAEGYWVGELVVDATLTSNYVLYMHWLGKVDFAKQAKCIRHILKEQLPDGGWNIYPGGPSEVNATVMAYLALKLGGFTPDEPEMVKARAVILRLGGIPKCNTWNKLNLALLGLFPWHHLPIIPAEIILLPNWLYFNIYEMSAWSRTMVIPLAVVNHYKPTHNLPADKQLHELYPYGMEHRDFARPWDKKRLSWRNFFLAWDWALKGVDALPWRPFRARAMRQAEEWITARIGPGSDGLGAIFPAMMYSIVALKAMGYTEEHPLLKRAMEEFDKFHVEDPQNQDFRIQPCFSPVWDTAITTVALIESGVPADAPAMRKAGEWLISKEVRHHRGDWAVKNPHPENSGWAFEYNNVYYPDVDDTFKVLLALTHIETEDEAAKKVVIERALKWAVSFQCKNGGWASFDKDVTKKWLQDVPFADHNAILDPPCSDITCRGLELFGRLGLKRSERFIQRAIRFVRETQDADGSWYGRWGVNYIYGTWLVLRGLEAIGEDMNQDWVLRGRDWLESCQNEDGGWGESPRSYDDPQVKGQGPSTASQTAWALMGILACGDAQRASVKRGVAYLAGTQQPDGQWNEEWITGTGFPQVFYLRYDMYRNNWPLLALAEYRRLSGRQTRKAEAWAASAVSMAEYRRQRDQSAADQPAS